MAKELHLEGGAPPLMPELAEVMPAGPGLMDRLVTEYEATVTLSTPQAFWTGLNGWTTDRLSGPIMEGAVSADEIGEQAWAVYATSCWGGMELRENWGTPPVIAAMGDNVPKAPFGDIQQGIIPLMTQRMEAVRAGGERCLEILPAILGEASTTGFIHNLGYNSGVQVVKTEDPPIGQRRPHRPSKPAAVRINGRDFLRVDYEGLATPMYLRVWRSAFERAVTAADPAEYERILAGVEGGTDLREIWRASVAFGNQTWGGDSQDGWTETYWEETIRWSSIVSFGLEAAAMAAFVALLDHDAEAARFAVMTNAIYLGASAGWFVGLLDIGAPLPKVLET
jgi:hypothetical protein